MPQILSHRYSEALCAHCPDTPTPTLALSHAQPAYTQCSLAKPDPSTHTRTVLAHHMHSSPSTLMSWIRYRVLLPWLISARSRTMVIPPALSHTREVLATWTSPFSPRSITQCKYTLKIIISIFNAFRLFRNYNFV